MNCPTCNNELTQKTVEDVIVARDSSLVSCCLRLSRLFDTRT